MTVRYGVSEEYAQSPLSIPSQSSSHLAVSSAGRYLEAFVWCLVWGPPISHESLQESISPQLGRNLGVTKQNHLAGTGGLPITKGAVLPLLGTEESDTLLDLMEAGDFRLCAAVPGDMVLFVICSLNTLGD